MSDGTCMVESQITDSMRDTGRFATSPMTSHKLRTCETVILAMEDDVAEEYLNLSDNLLSRNLTLVYSSATRILYRDTVSHLEISRVSFQMQELI